MARRRPNREHGLAGDTSLGSEYTAEELEFLRAMDRYKRERRRPFPAWSEVLAVLKSLGYQKPEVP